MLSLVIAATGLSFCLILYLCARDRKQDPDTQCDSGIELMCKSPFGR
jgi:hypothetical protein